MPPLSTKVPAVPGAGQLVQEGLQCVSSEGLAGGGRPARPGTVGASRALQLREHVLTLRAPVVELVAWPIAWPVAWGHPSTCSASSNGCLARGSWAAIEVRRAGEPPRPSHSRSASRPSS